MIYTFGQFELDLAAAELRAGGAVVHVEPQVFSLLALLVENSERLISRDEIIEKVWDGRIVSDAAIASRVKSARQALGDDGRAQQLIKTLHGQGYRFVGQARAVQSVAVVSAAKAEGLREMTNRPERMLRPSLAVLPFRFIGNDERYAPLASALPDELIADLARLRWLLVTARGSSFRLRAPEADFGDIGRLLNVRYCLWGTLETSADRLAVMVNLVDTENGSVVWAERFAGRVDDVHAMREQIRSQVLMALEIRIPMHEAGIARLSAVENLDAWSAYHLGLQHLYRFNRCDNDVAADLFRRAVVLEPTFARAHAGLSFVNFQAAFMQYTPDLAGVVGQARRSAERGLELDPLDPFVNFTMGRTYWLEGNLETSLGLARACDRHQPALCPGNLRARLDRSAGGTGGRSPRARRSGAAPEPARSAALRHAGHALIHSYGCKRGCGSRALGRARRPLARCTRADCDDRSCRARPRGQQIARNLLVGKCTRAQCLARPRGLFPGLSDAAAHHAPAHGPGAGAARVLLTGRSVRP
jgi:TolB-like protein